MPVQRIRFRPTDADDIRTRVDRVNPEDSVSETIRVAIRKYIARPERPYEKPESASVVLATFIEDSEMRAAVQKASREGRILSDVIMEIVREDD